MGVGERDPHTGHMTTGHEWNGIKELNTPVPRPVYFFLAATALFGIVYWILMPAWPIGVTYTKGLLGVDQRATVVQSLKQAQLDRSVWTKRIESETFNAVQSDPQLMTIVRQTGHALFGDNCAACHGANARGGKGFPNLTTQSWLWGGTPEAIAETIRVGINSPHADSRASQMPAFGHDQILPRADIENVVSYVRSLSDGAASNAAQADKIKAGKAIFAANCASCDGDTPAAAWRPAQRTLLISSGFTAVTLRRSTRRFGAAGWGTCRPGKAAFHHSNAKFSPFMSSI